MHDASGKRLRILKSERLHSGKTKERKKSIKIYILFGCWWVYAKVLRLHQARPSSCKTDQNFNCPNEPY